MVLAGQEKPRCCRGFSMGWGILVVLLEQEMVKSM